MARTRSKITITIDPDLLDTVKAAVGDGQAPSISAFIEHAVRGQLAAGVEFDSLLAEMLEATGGPPTEEERRVARQLLGPAA